MWKKPAAWGNNRGGGSSRMRPGVSARPGRASRIGSRGIGAGSRAGRASRVAGGLGRKGGVAGGLGGRDDSGGEAPPDASGKIAGLEPTVFYGLLGAGALVVLIAVIAIAASGGNGSKSRSRRYASGSGSYRPPASSTYRVPNYQTVPRGAAESQEEARRRWEMMHLGAGSH